MFVFMNSLIVTCPIAEFLQHWTSLAWMEAELTPGFQIASTSANADVGPERLRFQWTEIHRFRGSEGMADGDVWLLQRIVGIFRPRKLVFTEEVTYAELAHMTPLFGGVLLDRSLTAPRDLVAGIIQRARFGTDLTKCLVLQALHAVLQPALELSVAFRAVTNEASCTARSSKSFRKLIQPNTSNRPNRL
jgi:hypothetical protein